eukprot:jgi/Botrbrau1/16969/Bobra.49_2s0030.2
MQTAPSLRDSLRQWQILLPTCPALFVVSAVGAQQWQDGLNSGRPPWLDS